MSRSILFIGTSFLGAIKQGYDILFPENEATFIGLSAPELTAYFRDALTIKNGRLLVKRPLDCFVSAPEFESHKASRNHTFGNTVSVSDLDLDLSPFKTIIFVDMFYRTHTLLQVNEHGFASIGGTPASSTFLSRIQVPGFNGGSALRNHAKYGDVPYVNIGKFIRDTRNACDNANVFLISAPRAPEGNVDLNKYYGGVQEAKRCLDYIERFYKSELDKIGVRYLPQPIEILDSKQCLTDSKFSRGKHSRIQGLLDGHMNNEYGKITLSKYLDLLLS